VREEVPLCKLDKIVGEGTHGIEENDMGSEACFGWVFEDNLIQLRRFFPRLLS
jgi:hypothetical protein